MPRRRLHLVGLALAVSISASSFAVMPTAATAEAMPSDACKIEPNKQSQVSVGLPVSPDRLSGKERVTVMVVPFEFKDTKFDVSISSLQDRDQIAAGLIKTFSRNKANVQFRYAKNVLKYRRTLSEWAEFLKLRNQGWNERLDSLSTYGVVRELLEMVDQNEDLTGVDSVIFQSSLTSLQERSSAVGVYEAFMTTSDASGFFRSFKTDESQFFNAVLMTGAANPRTVAHELLHNFGLVDLYGNPGPEQAEGWSMMSSNEPTLFNWERWQLGWLAEDEVRCIDLRGQMPPSPFQIDLKGMNETGIKLLVFRRTNDETLALELRDPVVNPPGGQVVLAYSVSNNRYPGPIRTVNQPLRPTENDLKIGVQKTLADFEFMTLDVSLGSASIGIWHSSMASTTAVNNMRLLADANAQKRAEAEARAKLEAKAKADAEAKAAAAAAAKKAAAKKITITCIKGKQVKKVSGSNPKCPSGYKRK